MLPAARTRALARLPRQAGRPRRAHTSANDPPPPPQYELPNGLNNTYVPPAEEGMGKPFWISLGTIIASGTAYQMYTGAWQPGKDPLSQFLQKKQEELRKHWVEEGLKHNALMERAARDRVLMQNMPLNKVVTFRYLEQFNSGAPQNREAGWKSDLTPLKEFLKKEDEKREARGYRTPW